MARKPYQSTILNKPIVRKETTRSYKTKYHLPNINKKIRYLIKSKNNKTTKFTIDFTSNLSRLEYDIKDNKELKLLLSDLSLMKYSLIDTGFNLFYNNNVTIICIYMEYDREYSILQDGELLYRQVLDSPKEEHYFIDYEDDE